MHNIMHKMHARGTWDLDVDVTGRAVMRVGSTARYSST